MTTKRLMYSLCNDGFDVYADVEVDFAPAIFTRKNRRLLRKYFIQRKLQFLAIKAGRYAPSDEAIKEICAIALWQRLMVIRVRNILIELASIVSVWSRYCQAVKWFDTFTRPVLDGAGWVFQGGRLALDLFCLLKHTIPGSWMDREELEKGWLPRLETQLSKRGAMIVNDVLWVCTTLYPSSLFFAVLVSFFDVYVASLQALTEINRLNEARQCHQENRLYLQQAVSYEQKKLLLRIVSVSCINILIVLKLLLPLLLPGMALNPVIPLVIVSLLLIVTIAGRLAMNWFEKQRPDDKMACLPKANKSPCTNRFAFFTPDVSEVSSNPILEETSLWEL